METLNLQDNTKRLLLLALNKCGTIKEAAPVLGVSDRTVSRWLKIWNIRKIDDQYVVVEKLKLVK